MNWCHTIIEVLFYGIISYTLLVAMFANSSEKMNCTWTHFIINLVDLFKIKWFHKEIQNSNNKCLYAFYKSILGIIFKNRDIRPEENLRQGSIILGNVTLLTQWSKEILSHFLLHTYTSYILWNHSGQGQRFFRHLTELLASPLITRVGGGHFGSQICMCDY